MSIYVFIKIFSVCLLGAMSPGPSMVVVINNAVFKNRYHGILTSLGHGFGIGLYALFAVIGIAVIIKTNLFIFNTIKSLSIIFLIYLGFKSILTSDHQLDFDEKNHKGSMTSFFQGLSISLLNPKIFVWFLAIYSQFMSIKNDIVFNTYLILTAGIVDTIWYITLTYLVTSVMAINFIKVKSKLLKKFIGYIFIMVGLLLILELLF